MPNRLAVETSPYLRQHAQNPVDWYPWGPEALARARGERKPIFLSVGYSACHWCHVMAHESFENAETARLLNAHFISVKLDREERPDLDAICMRAVQIMTGQGGWPLSVFLTPDLDPFFGGTYFPPEPRFGMPSFRQVLSGVERAFREEPESVARAARGVRDALATSFAPEPGPPADAGNASEDARLGILRRYDPRSGGFGAGPKFPQPPLLEFLLLEAVRLADEDVLGRVRFTLERMERGGLRDQVGGGFHRYAVDGEWRVPHYEKMLYDNAQLASLYALTHRVTGDAAPLRVAREVLDDLERSFALPGGGFAAALDADSEGEEGRYYRWTPDQVTRVLGREEGGFFVRAFGLGEGYDELAATTPHRPLPWREASAAEGMAEEGYRARVETSVGRLRAARALRPPPAPDTKVLTDWNALAASAYFGVARASADPAYARRGLDLLSFLGEAARDGETLLHIAGDGTPRIPGFLSDYAYFAQALFAAYEATGSGCHLKSCEALLKSALTRFRDGESGFLYEARPESGDLRIPVRDDGDGVLPSSLGVLARTLWAWERLVGGGWARGALDELLRLEAGTSLRNPPAHPFLAGLSLWRTLPPIDVVVAGPADVEPTPALLRAARRPAHPLLLSLPIPKDPPAGPGWNSGGLFEGKEGLRAPAAFLCAGGTCAPPIAEPRTLAEAIERACRTRAPSS